MKKKVLIFAHNDKVFQEEILSCLEGLDIDIYSEDKCTEKENIKYDWKPDIVIFQTTAIKDGICPQHIKTLSKETAVIIAERDATIERYIDMQMLGVKDYFSVPLIKENIRNAVIELITNFPDNKAK